MTERLFDTPTNPGFSPADPLTDNPNHVNLTKDGQRSLISGVWSDEGLMGEGSYIPFERSRHVEHPSDHITPKPEQETVPEPARPMEVNEAKPDQPTVPPRTPARLGWTVVKAATTIKPEPVTEEPKQTAPSEPDVETHAKSEPKPELEPEVSSEPAETPTPETKPTGNEPSSLEAMMATIKAIRDANSAITSRPEKPTEPPLPSSTVPEPELKYPDIAYSDYRRPLPRAPHGFAGGQTQAITGFKTEAEMWAAVARAGTQQEATSIKVNYALNTLFGRGPLFGNRARREALKQQRRDPLEGEPDLQYARDLIYQEVLLIDETLKHAPQESDNNMINKEVRRRKELLLIVQKAEKPKGEIGRSLKDLRHVVDVYDFVQAERERRQYEGKQMNNKKDITGIYIANREAVLAELNSGKEISPERRKQLDGKMARARLAQLFQRPDGTYPFY